MTSRYFMLSRRISIVLFIVLVVSGTARSQKTVASPYWFSMAKPNGWMNAEKALVDESVKKLALYEAEIDTILNKSNNTLLLMAFIKYEQGTIEGVIPTIQVRLRSNPFKDFSQFMNGFVRSIEPSKMPFRDYKHLFPPKQIVLNGKQAVHYSGTYTLETKKGLSTTVRSKGYAIPHGKSFFHITFLDDPESEDCSAEFDGLLKSIKIGR